MSTQSTSANRKGTIRTATLGVAAAALLVPLASITPSQAAPTVPTGYKGPLTEEPANAVPGVVKHTTTGRSVSQALVKQMFATATPARATGGKPLPAALRKQAGPSGPTVSTKGVAPSSPGKTIVGPQRASATATNAGAVWPGAYNSNPNRQVGKLFFDKDPGAAYNWGWCTATAINTTNKSTILTAGHCVSAPGSRKWYTNLVFYPGFEYTRHVGAWKVRNFWTTNNWFYNTYWADDMAMAVVYRDAAGVPLVNRVGGHGIQFNGAVGQWRTSLGYPVTDYRFPGYTADGQDLRYCQGVDRYYSSGLFAGQMLLGCRMTGGASGGPWLTAVRSDWMGTVQSVNSNKTGADVMFGPYLGAGELAVYQAAHAA